MKQCRIGQDACELHFQTERWDQRINVIQDDPNRTSAPQRKRVIDERVSVLMFNFLNDRTTLSRSMKKFLKEFTFIAKIGGL